MVTNSLAPPREIWAALSVVKTNLIHFVHAWDTGNRVLAASKGEITR
jgi:hypothetical protein